MGWALENWRSLTLLSKTNKFVESSIMLVNGETLCYPSTLTTSTLNNSLTKRLTLVALSFGMGWCIPRTWLLAKPNGQWVMEQLSIFGGMIGSTQALLGRLRPSIHRLILALIDFEIG